MPLYEVLVPVKMDKKKVRKKYHRKWDAKVREIAGGLTIMKSVKGEWVSTNGKCIKEKMIQVRIACDETFISEIVNLTIKHYEQEAVMWHKVTDEVYISR